MAKRRRDPFAYHYNEDDEDSLGDTLQLIGGQLAGMSTPVPMPVVPATELTEKVAENLIQLVTEGMMIADAAKYMMIHHSTIRAWLRAGEQDPTSMYGWFVARIEQAQAVFMQEMVGNVRRNARNDGNVALKTLEKVARGDWASNGTTEVKGTIVHEHVGKELARIVEERKEKKRLAASVDVDRAGEGLQAPVQGVYREEAQDDLQRGETH